MTGEYRPYTLVAELTYRCPLRCPYCSNPLDYARHDGELDTATWLRVLTEAEELGVVQLNLTGGEPLIRDDLERLVERARALDLYTNLITSGIPLTHERLAGLRALGLDNVQVSIQDVTAAGSDRIAGLRSFERKLEVARWVKDLGMPLTMNTVLHRDNLDHVAEVVALAESLGADRLELANTQYLGWALLNRRALLPTREQLERARAVAHAARERLRGTMEVLFVFPDYYAEFPKSCMDGWGRRFLVVSPDGRVLPCHLAHTLPGLVFESVKDRPLAAIWGDSRRLQRLSRRGVDARAVPELRPSRDRLRRLPLPGLPPHRQRGRHRSRLLAGARPPPDRGGPRGGGRAGRGRRRFRVPGSAPLFRRSQAMIRIALVVALFGLGVVSARAADPPAPVRVSVLKFGTVSWELDVMQHHGLAAREGVDVRVTQLASPGAATVALQGGSADLIVTDWIWVSRQRAQGRPYTFVPVLADRRGASWCGPTPGSAPSATSAASAWASPAARSTRAGSCCARTPGARSARTSRSSSTRTTGGRRS